MKIYLAGTISKNPNTTGWREKAIYMIDMAGHTPISPMRFQSTENFTAGGMHDSTTPDSFFVDVDLGDIRRCDIVLLVYWKRSQPVSADSDINVFDPQHGYNRQSIGTWSEFAIAAWEHKPVIVVTDDPEVADHPFIKRHAAIVVETVEEGLEWVKKILI